MIRFIITILFIFIFLLISLILIPIGLLIGLFSKKARRSYSRCLVHFALGMVQVFSGAKAEYIGFENVPKDESVTFIMNHRSIFDIILIYHIFPRCMGFVAKKEMEKLFVFTWWMKMIDCKFLDRNDVRQGMEIIKESGELVKDGVTMAICPEGTRNKTDEVMLEFHKGSFKIAERAGSKLVPVVFNNTEDIFEKHFPKLKPVHVTIEFLPAIDVSQMSMPEKKLLSENVREDMVKTYIKNQELI